MLSIKAIVLGALAIVLLGVASFVLLVHFFGTAEAAPQLEAVKTASTFILGAGGAGALILAARRQRSAELTLKENARIAAENQADRAKDLAQRERANQDLQLDAIERRITDLYTKAADQVGNEKPAVRLAGLYALERLANDTPSQRQAILNVISAYLRMPYRRLKPIDYDDPDPDEDVASSAEEFIANSQEWEVRHAAQEIVVRGITSDWTNLHLNLSGAYLEDFELLHASTIASATFKKTIFAGSTVFLGCHFNGRVVFEGVHFAGRAEFINVQFMDGSLLFRTCGFERGFLFSAATFASGTKAEFLDAYSGNDQSSFEGCELPNVMEFQGGIFAGLGFGACRGNFLKIGSVTFHGNLSCRRTKFNGIWIGGRTKIRNGSVAWVEEFAGSVELGEPDMVGYRTMSAQIGNLRVIMDDVD